MSLIPEPYYGVKVEQSYPCPVCGKAIEIPDGIYQLIHLDNCPHCDAPVFVGIATETEGGKEITVLRLFKNSPRGVTSDVHTLIDGLIEGIPGIDVVSVDIVTEPFVLFHCAIQIDAGDYRIRDFVHEDATIGFLVCKYNKMLSELKMEQGRK